LTVTLAGLLMPPGPLQVSEYVELDERAAVARVPLVGSAPLQAPVAAQEVAFVEDHVSIDVAPGLTEVGCELNVVVGRGAGLELSPAPPPHAASNKAVMAGQRP
jgi:hypothetical protein